MSIAPPVAPVLGRIQSIAARFEPVAPSAASQRASTVSAAMAARASGFDAVLSDALGTGTADAGSSGAGTSAGGLDLGGLGDLGSVMGALVGSGGDQRIDLRRGGSSTAGAPDGADALAAATRYLGVPYKWGGTDPAIGLDCSALVQRAYADIGVQLPRVSYDQAKAGRPVSSLAEARPGDLIAFGQPVDHIALYVGDGKILQAPRSGQVVSITDIGRPIAAIRRVVGEGGPTTPGASSATAGSAGSGGGTTIPGSERFAALFEAAGRRHGVAPELLAAVAKVESNFNPDAVSPAGARGLMQIMPATARGLGVDPSDPAQAIDGAARYLRAQLQEFGSVDLALAAYNAGPGAVRRFDGIPPYAETRSYVAKVTSHLPSGSNPLSRSLIGAR